MIQEFRGKIENSWSFFGSIRGEFLDLDPEVPNKSPKMTYICKKNCEVLGKGVPGFSRAFETDAPILGIFFGFQGPNPRTSRLTPKKDPVIFSSHPPPEILDHV